MHGASWIVVLLRREKVTVNLRIFQAGSWSWSTYGSYSWISDRALGLGNGNYHINNRLLRYATILTRCDPGRDSVVQTVFEEATLRDYLPMYSCLRLVTWYKWTSTSKYCALLCRQVGTLVATYITQSAIRSSDRGQKHKHKHKQIKHLRRTLPITYLSDKVYLS